jgi:hypothetical protein
VRGAFALRSVGSLSLLLLLPSLVAGASQQLLVFVLSHLFLPLLNDTSHCITSILFGLTIHYYTIEGLCPVFSAGPEPPPESRTKVSGVDRAMGRIYGRIDPPGVPCRTVLFIQGNMCYLNDYRAYLQNQGNPVGTASYLHARGETV